MEGAGKLKCIGVSKLISALFRDPFSIPPEERRRKSSMVHDKLGYTNTISFAKYFEGVRTDIHWLVIGVPDLIEIEEDKVIELKVASPTTKSMQERIGDVQANIYAHLGEFPKYRVDIFYWPKNKLIIGEVKQTDTERAISDIIKALSIIESFYEKRKKS